MQGVTVKVMRENVRHEIEYLGNEEEKLEEQRWC